MLLLAHLIWVEGTQCSCLGGLTLVEGRWEEGEVGGEKRKGGVGGKEERICP